MSTPLVNSKKKTEKSKIHGNRIKGILSDIKMSQQEFADKCFDGNRSYVSRVINNQVRCISLPTAFRISKILKRPIEQIFIYNHRTN